MDNGTVFTAFDHGEVFTANHVDLVPFLGKVTNLTGIRFISVESLELGEDIYIDDLDYKWVQGSLRFNNFGLGVFRFRLEFLCLVLKG